MLNTFTSPVAGAIVTKKKCQVDMAAGSSKDYCSPQILGRCWTERRSRHKDTVSHLHKELVHLPSVSILNAWS